MPGLLISFCKDLVDAVITVVDAVVTEHNAVRRGFEDVDTEGIEVILGTLVTVLILDVEGVALSCVSLAAKFGIS